MTIAEELAERIQSVSYDRLPAEAVHWARVSILDTLGVAIAGSREPGVRILRHTLTEGMSRGNCQIFGARCRASALDAALINGMAAHALDFDTSNHQFSGHPSVHLLAATYALGEKLDVSGKAFLTAYVAGFEAQLRIARGVQPDHSARGGWFASGTIGVFGSAAAASHLLRLSPEQTAVSLGIAGNLASGFLANAGTMAQPLTSGHCARSGVLAALLARDGVTASLDVFEHKEGFLNMFDGPGRFDIQKILASWGEPYDILETAVGIKQHPCSGILQSSIDVLGDLVVKHDLDPDNVARVDALLISDRLPHVDRPDPRSGIDAKFSAQYCLARTLMHGRTRLEDFEGDEFHDPSVRLIMERIHLAVHPDLNPSIPWNEQYGAEIRVAMKDGRLLAGRADQPFGRKLGEPLPTRLLEAKFMDCAGRVLSKSATEKLLELVRTIDLVPRLWHVSDAMTPAEKALLPN